MSRLVGDSRQPARKEVDVQQVHEIDNPQQDRSNRAAFVEQMDPGDALSSGLFDEISARVARSRGIDALQPANGLLQASTMQDQELERLRERENHDGGDRQGGYG